MTPSRTSPVRADFWTERACDLFLLVFAAWTLACHGVVFSGGGLPSLLIAAPLVLGLLAWLWRWTWSPQAVDCPGIVPSGRRGTWALAAAGAGSLVGATWMLSHSVDLTWWVAVSACLGALIWANRGVSRELETLPDTKESPDTPGKPSQHWRGPALLALALLGALATQLIQRPDFDDCYYVNVSTAIADAPHDALLSHDTLYGITDLPLMLSVYKLHSFEVLGGAIAWLTPLSAIQATHLALPLLFGFFIALAVARLARRLAPRTWFQVTLVTLVLLATTAETHRWWGNFAFARQQQGKGVFLTTLVPLLIAAGMDFARRPNRRGFLRLVLAHVAAIGATATALWAGPVAAGLGLAAGTAWSPKALGRTSLGLFASSYPVALGLALRGSMAKVIGQLPLPGAEPIAHGDHPALVQSAWDLSVGTGPLAMACLIAVAAAWGIVASNVARRALAAIALVFLVVLSNPYTAQFVADGVTSSMTYFRVFWVLPLPLFLALILTTPARLWPGTKGVGATWVATILFLVFIPRLYALSPENRARFEPFALKVDPEPYEAARLLVEQVPARVQVAAPLSPSVYVGTFSQHPYAVISRRDYLRFLEPYRPKAELGQRGLVGWVLDHPKEINKPEMAQAFARGLGQLEVRGLITFAADPKMPPFLRRLGYHRVDGTRHYAVWVRDPQ